MLSVIGKVNKRLLEKLKTDADAPYHNKTLEFSSVSTNTPTVFPTLAVESLGEVDADSTLERDKQSAIWSTVELTAFTNTSLKDANTLLGYAWDVMYSMFYDKISEQVLSNTKPFCKVARFRRKVGSDDLLY